MSDLARMEAPKNRAPLDVTALLNASANCLIELIELYTVPHCIGFSRLYQRILPWKQWATSSVREKQLSTLVKTHN